ncbi:hypothetical protein HEP74_00675 [Xanthomonas sp. SS]|uniref:hypothetical protein n=1 Tax=Xanthomonas sp. SS TaxID=2724122 RepID=UPI00163AF23C|nr:hypothetical protein [Xanthomonas sp. SS]QNH15552.1 hypothetical protein HEP74_00675 [Xanthomonas sp. SS]
MIDSLTPKDFLRRVDQQCLRQMDRALALLWFVGREDQTAGLTAKEIAELIRAVGHAEQNVSRLGVLLSTDKRTVAAKLGGWMLRAAARRELDAVYADHVGPIELPASDSLVPMALVNGTRGYISKVADQVNKSFDAKLYDCCAVMCRRLIETLIIETYEKHGRAPEIRDGSQYVGLNEMVGRLENDPSMALSRPAMQTLKGFKAIGDLSAHNRHWNARLGDIDPHKIGFRQVLEELLYRAGMHPSNPAAAA